MQAFGDASKTLGFVYAATGAGCVVGPLLAGMCCSGDGAAPRRRRRRGGVVVGAARAARAGAPLVERVVGRVGDRDRARAARRRARTTRPTRTTTPRAR